MKLVFISDDGNHYKEIAVKLWPYIIPPFLLMIGAVAMVVSFNALTSQSLASKSDYKAFKNFSSVINKLGHLDAEVQRLNSLGSYIASKSDIDIKDYALTKAPARGGAIKINKKYFGSSIVRKPDVINSVKAVENNIARQKLKLNHLVTSLEIKEAEDYLKAMMNPKTKKLSTKISTTKSSKKAIAYEFSTPLKKGYISSPYGNRRDPINGSLRHHSGLDIAAKKGSNVYAVANGFVTFKGRKGAYGNLLEINHSASLKSRYAHLDSFLVKQGQAVRKGDLIGKVGSTGRVTGPHLHLEIKENNRVKNPKVYLKDVLRAF